MRHSNVFNCVILMCLIAPVRCICSCYELSAIENTLHARSFVESNPLIIGECKLHNW